MTTTNLNRVLHQRGRAYDYASMGAQSEPVCIAAPAAASTLVGKGLDGQTLSVNGDYVCLIPIAGLTSVKVNIRATLAGGAGVTSAGPDELAQFNPRTDSIEDAVVITAGTGDGALSTGTLQTASLTPTGGIYARYTLTVASAGTAAITVAEIVGL